MTFRMKCFFHGAKKADIFFTDHQLPFLTLLVPGDSRDTGLWGCTIHFAENTGRRRPPALYVHNSLIPPFLLCGTFGGTCNARAGRRKWLSAHHANFTVIPKLGPAGVCVLLMLKRIFPLLLTDGFRHNCFSTFRAIPLQTTCNNVLFATSLTNINAAEFASRAVFSAFSGLLLLDIDAASRAIFAARVPNKRVAAYSACFLYQNIPTGFFCAFRTIPAIRLVGEIYFATFFADVLSHSLHPKQRFRLRRHFVTGISRAIFHGADICLGNTQRIRKLSL